MLRTLCLLMLTSFAVPAFAQSEMLRADASRIEARIKALSVFGSNDDGGVDRVAYSPADLAGRAWAMAEMKTLGLEDIRIDTGGNILGRRPGTDEYAKPIMFGSHIDSVLGGGNYDGPAGVIAAFEVIDLLNEGGVVTRSPLDVVIFSNEEGGLIGSLAIAGRLGRKTLNVVSDSGLTIGEGIKIIGGDPERLDEAVIANDALKAFFELHIEQGAFIDRDGIDIGVVEGIVGIEWWDITISGISNHAGTTPMNQRADALVGASKLVLAINEIARETPGRQVATVGRITALPGAPNVIPGEVKMTLEVRDLSVAKIESVYQDVRAAAATITEETGVTIDFVNLNVASHPALTDPALRDIIAQAATSLGLTHRVMPSGAGHDAQDMASIAPTGMIFVPSVGGISHSPKEFTHAQDIANGSDVLLRAILAVDGQ